MSQMKAAVEQGMLMPTCEFVVIDNKNVNDLLRHIDDVVIAFVESRLKKDRKFDSIAVQFAGDHGQGAFNAGAKIILYDSNGIFVEWVVEKVGMIDCANDTYNILKQTIKPA